MKEIQKKVKGFILYNLGVLKLIFYWKTKKYLSKYYCLNNKEPVVKDKTIIYMLDGRVYSGGITDIIRGIISMYKFSKEVGFNFRIKFNYPYELKEYLEPNLYNWYVSEDEISYNSNTSIPLWLYCAHNSYGKTREFENDFQTDLLNRFIKRNAAKTQYHIYTNSQFAKEYEYSVLFNELFRPSKLLQGILNQHKLNLGVKYISITFRFQQLLGDFIEKESGADFTTLVLEKFSYNLNDSRSNVLPAFGELQTRAILGDFKNKKISVPLNDKDKRTLLNRCLKEIVDFHATCCSDVKILITADSEIFLQEVKKLNFVYTINKKNKLTDINNKLDVFIKPYIDMFILSDAEKIFLFRTKSMYQSGFAKNASYIKNHEYKEVIF